MQSNLFSPPGAPGSHFEPRSFDFASVTAQKIRRVPQVRTLKLGFLTLQRSFSHTCATNPLQIVQSAVPSFTTAEGSHARESTNQAADNRFAISGNHLPGPLLLLGPGYFYQVTSLLFPLARSIIHCHRGEAHHCYRSRSNSENNPSIVAIEKSAVPHLVSNCRCLILSSIHRSVSK